MNTIHEPHLMQREAEHLRAAGKRIALVPTMGALHAGHAALIREARARGDAVVVTLFVNPAQFGQGEDYGRYPRDLDGDVLLASGAGGDILFAPEPKAMYPPGYQTYVSVERLSLPLEGAARPGHFRGVTTVVTKLLNITRPHVAVFGQKDAQQVVVLRRMARDLDFGVEIVVVPTVRERDGLALSSRNAYLTPAQRNEAPVLHRALKKGEDLIRAGERSADAVGAAVASEITAGSSAAIDYVSVADAESLEPLSTLRPGATVLVSLAARFGTTRLIDNVLISI
ncbi:MAG TPA: pantoate--beta-alanine ligase [Bacteroidota bacterium]|nr:pantoate--beta-alanine ligase [Bacteroidota bacterium]